MEKLEIQKIIGDECRIFRLYTMAMSLQELSEKSGINVKTLSGFENGRSSNIYIFYIYLTYLSDIHKSALIDNIILRSDRYAEINRQTKGI